MIIPSSDELSVEAWWTRNLKDLNGERRPRMAGFLMYAAWHLWTERNRRVFDRKNLLPSQVLSHLKEDVALRRVARGSPGFESELV